MKSKAVRSKSASEPSEGGGAGASDVTGEAAAPTGVLPAAVDVDESMRTMALREAVLEAGDDSAVGPFVDAHSDGGDVVTMRFEASLDGYRGWRWSVTLSVIDPSRPTVSEVVLLPGPNALLAPAWVPWEERVRSGDLGVGDLLPPAPDDERIVPAYVMSDDPAVEELAREVGIGRVRVLSREGRIDAAERWHSGSFGPEDEVAKHAPATCATCAFFVPLAGSLGAGFGVCANEYSPADGRVVDVSYGCGAHSEAVVDRAAASATGDNVLDELQLDVFLRGEDPSDTETAEDTGSEPGLGSDLELSTEDDSAASSQPS